MRCTGIEGIARAPPGASSCNHTTISSTPPLALPPLLFLCSWPFVASFLCGTRIPPSGGPPPIPPSPLTSSLSLPCDCFSDALSHYFLSLHPLLTAPATPPDLSFMSDILSLIRSRRIAAPAPIEQRWTSGTRSRMSPVAGAAHAAAAACEGSGKGIAHSLDRHHGVYSWVSGAIIVC